MQRLLPGLACMGGLFGVSVPLTAAVYDLDAEWVDFTAQLAAADDAAEELRITDR